MAKVRRQRSVPNRPNSLRPSDTPKSTNVDFIFNPPKYYLVVQSEISEKEEKSIIHPQNVSRIPRRRQSDLPCKQIFTPPKYSSYRVQSEKEEIEEESTIHPQDVRISRNGRRFRILSRHERSHAPKHKGESNRLGVHQGGAPAIQLPKLKVRWSLQDEIANIFDPSLEFTFCRLKEGLSCSISPRLKEDADYLCTNVAETWPKVRKTMGFSGPTDAGLFLRNAVMLEDSTGMIERCVVCGPGFLMFKLSTKWIAKSIHKMVKAGIDICAPKQPVERAILYFLSGNITKNMHTGHLRSTVIGETLARILEYSRVEVIRRFHEEDLIELKMMTEFLIEKFPNGIVKDLSPQELEVLYTESKKKFDEDAEFRERAQKLQSKGFDRKHRIAWVQVAKISRESNKKLYECLGVHVKEEVSCFDPFDSLILETCYSPREIANEGGEAILIEGRKFSVDLAALWYAVNVVKADWILHVTDVERMDRFEMCISAAKRAGLIVNDRCPYPLSHVGFGPVEADNVGSLRTLSTTVVYLVNLLGEAKTRCKAVLLRQGKADEWTAEELDDTAEALGYGAVKYAVLKSNRLTKCTIDFDEILNEKGNTVVYLHYTHAQVCSIITEYIGAIKKLKKSKGKKEEKLTLKNVEERELGLHLLRFTEVLGDVCTLLMPHILCDYLYDLCKKFDSFYSVTSQVGYSDLLLCEATKQVMGKCFHLLAITPIHKKILKSFRAAFSTENQKLQGVQFDHADRLFNNVRDTWSDFLENKFHCSELAKRFYFSDLTEQQVMELFSKGPCFRYDMCNVVVGLEIDDEVDIRTSYGKLIIYGIIQAETHMTDPSHSFNLLNTDFDNPLEITNPASLSPCDFCYCSLPVSTTVKITAKLYGTTYTGDGMESYSEYRIYYPPRKIEGEDPYDLFKFLQTGKMPTTAKKKKKYLDDDAVEICDGSVCKNFSEYFANRPNGGSGYSRLKGKDGYLDLYYVVLKYAVEAALEVGFVATSKETRVFGRVMAYYGQNFWYGSERALYNAMLFEIKKPSHIEPGKINLMRSALAVPARYSLIIDADLHDFTSGDMILSGVCEFFVPVDGSSSVGFIKGKDCSLKLKVDWKLPI